MIEKLIDDIGKNFKNTFTVRSNHKGVIYENSRLLDKA